MINSGSRKIGVLVLICLAALVAAPAFAADQGHAFKGGTSFVLNATTETKMYDSASNTVTSLQDKGIDVSGLGLTAALSDMRSAIGSNSTAFRNAMQTFGQDIMAAVRDGSLPQSDLQVGTGQRSFQRGSEPVMNSSMETKMFNSASTMVTSLQDKGVDVSNLGLTTALSDMQSAIGSNSTAFKNAMQTLGKDIMTDIKTGSIPKTDLSFSGQGRAGGVHSSTFITSHHTGSTPMV